MCTVLFNPVKFKAAKCEHKLLAYIIYTPSPSRLNEEILSFCLVEFMRMFYLIKQKNMVRH